MRNETVWSRWVAFAAGGLLSVCGVPMSVAVAFPFIDASNADSAPTGAPLGTDLPAADVSGLQGQLRLLNPGAGAAGNPSGWTIVPRFSMQEQFTDNVLGETSPRRSDSITNLAPGISIGANTFRVQLNFDYSPTLAIHTIDGPLNAVTQQLNMIGTIMVVPDFVYVDVRALSGVQSRLGGLAGSGTLGTTDAGALSSATTSVPATSAGAASLNRLNEVQTTSFGLSPYLLRKFGDYGTAKLGVSVNVSRSASLSGFAQPPIPTGGTNGQSLLTTEQIAQFTTGEKFGKWQDSLNVDMSQSGTQADATSGAPATTTTSRRQTVTNQVSYALSHVFTLQASIGEQNIQYSQSAAPSVNGLTWSVGLTVTPDPYSSITIKYGHQNGVDNVTGDAHVALTGRTMLTADYSNSIGTQLENLQNQLNNSVLTQYGSQINALTGGPAYVASNGLGSQNGVFRFNTLNASLSTTWDRDTLQATLSWSMQTSVSPGYGLSSITIDPITDVATLNYAPTVSTGQSTVLKTASVIWTHSLRPELTLSTSAAYNTTQRSGSLGSDGSLSSSIGLQYQFPSGSTLSARYSFFDRISKIPGYSLYENLALVGFTKKF